MTDNPQTEGDTANEAFDISRVHWEHGKFEPWHVTNQPEPLESIGLNQDEALLVGEVACQPLGFLLREVVYHHVVQGEWAGEPFMLTFCGVCNAGVVTSPVIEGQVHRFREVGVYNGQMIYTDDETETLWNHLTGEALHGPLLGTTLPVSSLAFSTVRDQLDLNPSLPVFQSGQHPRLQRAMAFIIRRVLGDGSRQWLPPHFTKTLPAIVDDRLPPMTMGVAVVEDDTAVFYPKEMIEAGQTGRFGERTLQLTMQGAFPVATWPDGTRPFQLFTRWYAFILTYPHGQPSEQATPTD